MGKTPARTRKFFQFCPSEAELAEAISKQYTDGSEGGSASGSEHPLLAFDDSDSDEACSVEEPSPVVQVSTTRPGTATRRVKVVIPAVDYDGKAAIIQSYCRLWLAKRKAAATVIQRVVRRRRRLLCWQRAGWTMFSRAVAGAVALQRLVRGLRGRRRVVRRREEVEWEQRDAAGELIHQRLFGKVLAEPWSQTQAMLPLPPSPSPKTDVRTSASATAVALRHRSLLSEHQEGETGEWVRKLPQNRQVHVRLATPAVDAELLQLLHCTEGYPAGCIGYALTAGAASASSSEVGQISEVETAVTMTL